MATIDLSYTVPTTAKAAAVVTDYLEYHLLGMPGLDISAMTPAQKLAKMRELVGNHIESAVRSRRQTRRAAAQAEDDPELT